MGIGRGSRFWQRWLGIRRGLVVTLVSLATVSALSGVAPGTDRDAAVGAASPLAWLSGYVPWPFLLLAGIGLAAWGWRGAPQGLAPLLLIGGVPALFYLPDPLVTGDHPWMVRRLVPAVIPLLAIAASAGAGVLWREFGRWPRGIVPVGPAAAAILVGIGLAIAVASDRDLLGPPHAAGAIAGVETLAADLPPHALVVFPAGPPGIHLAMPLSMVFGVDAFAVPPGIVTPATVDTLKRLEAAGRAIYWVAEGTAPPSLAPEVTATPVRTIQVAYDSADHGPVPPPLQFIRVEDRVTLYRLSFTIDRTEAWD
jgi:hypothetical protein